MSLIEKYAFRGDCAVRPLTDGAVAVSGPCYSCGKPQSVQVDSAAFKKFQHGQFVQDCFPRLSPAEREFLLSGICGTCWDEMFQDFEEDE